MSFADVIRKLAADSLAEEGITPEDLELVDLEIQFSPVIPIRSGKLQDAVEVIQCRDKTKYLVQHPMFPNAVDAEGLKIMRYRYLKKVAFDYSKYTGCGGQKYFGFIV